MGGFDDVLEEIRKLRRERDEFYYDTECLAALSFLFLDENGNIPKGLLGKHSALDKALKQMQYRNAWVVCGPVSNGKEKFLDEFDGRIERRGGAK